MIPIPHIDPEVEYPESDGKPMADNTEQYQWLVKIKENLESWYANVPDVFIAGDLFWYLPLQYRR
jgi:Uma2 family endonuclease